MTGQDRQAVLQKVRASADRSARWAEAFQALEERTFDNTSPLVQGYVRDKFLLEPEECGSDLILALADISLRKILRLKKEGKLAGDISRGCSGASSVISKKVLFMKSVQTDFGITLTPKEAAAVSTVEQLTRSILQQRA